MVIHVGRMAAEKNYPGLFRAAAASSLIEQSRENVIVRSEADLAAAASAPR
jgi:hypothetical protein